MFSCEKFILDYYNKINRELNLSTKQEHIRWKDENKKLLEKTLTLHKFSKDIKVVDRVKTDNKVEEIYLQTQNNLVMPTYFLENKSSDMVVIAIHCHGSNGKEGLVFPENTFNGDKFNSGYGSDLYNLGYEVYCPDLMGCGKRREEKEKNDELKSSCTNLNNLFNSLGISFLGATVYDIICLIDYIKTQTDKEVCLWGFSGGGLISLVTSALDERVDYTFVSGYFHNFKDTVLYNNLCGCNFPNNFWNNFDLSKIAALIAPRKLYIQRGREDKLNGKRGIISCIEEVEKVNRVYNLYDKEVYFEIFEGGHSFSKTAFENIDKWRNGNE